MRHEIADRGGRRSPRSTTSSTATLPQPGEPAAGAAAAAPADAVVAREIVPDDVLLFRYSALTFNGHRIHYDRRYVTEVEGYPGLIVHGPLIATLLVDLLRREHARRACSRASSSRRCGRSSTLQPFTVCGQPAADGERRAALGAQTHEGCLAMQATAELA